MDENRIEEILSDLSRRVEGAPLPPLEEMWAVIEAAHFDAPKAIESRGSRSFAPWLAAATLLLGIGIGRYLPSPSPERAMSRRSVAAVIPRNRAETSGVADPYRDQTTRYLGQAAALLISLPAESANTRTDAAFAGKAADLLVTTRLLIDSPAARDPKLRSLLEDLELVLVQIARLRVERSRGDLDLIHQAVEQGDVLSRLNSAGVTTQSAV
jgi:hypothetical protein